MRRRLVRGGGDPPGSKEALQPDELDHAARRSSLQARHRRQVSSERDAAAGRIELAAVRGFSISSKRAEMYG
jgi:hypothetical protein